MFWLQRQQLKSRNANTRLKAVEGLAASQTPSGLKALTQASKDSEVAVRCAAVTALGKSEDPAAVSAIIEALRDSSPEVRRAAVDGLKKNVPLQARTPLVQALRDPDANVRGRAARRLDQQGWKPSNAQEEIWFYAAQGKLALAASHGPAAIPALEVVLNGGPYNLRAAAIAALGSISDERVTRLLLPALKSPDQAVCVAAIEAISKIGGRKVLEGLLPLLRHEDHRIRVAAIESLSGLDIQQTAPRLMELLKDSMWDVRCAAAVALAKVKDPLVVDSLAGLLTTDPDTDVREAAATSLGRLSDRRAIGTLVLALKDSESSVRRAAVSALPQVDPHWAESEEARAVAHELRAAMGAADPAVQHAAATALKRIGDISTRPTFLQEPGLLTSTDKLQRRSVAILLELLRDADTDLRLAAAASLGRLGDRSAVSSLMTVLSDADPFLRRAARESLNMLGIR